ncbi:MAG: DUF2933 domain-containing protein [Porticoccaceae bacterium]
MSRMSNREQPTEQGQRAWRQPRFLAVATLTVIGVFFLLREHWGHVLGLWPYALLLACPLMHLFHGHGGHQHRREDSQRHSETRQ